MERLPEHPVMLKEVNGKEPLGERNLVHRGPSQVDFGLVLALVEGNDAVPEGLKLLPSCSGCDTMAMVALMMQVQAILPGCCSSLMTLIVLTSSR